MVSGRPPTPISALTPPEKTPNTACSQNLDRSVLSCAAVSRRVSATACGSMCGCSLPWAVVATTRLTIMRITEKPLKKSARASPDSRAASRVNTRAETIDGRAMTAATGRAAQPAATKEAPLVTVDTLSEARETPLAESCDRPSSGWVMPGMMNWAPPKPTRPMLPPATRPTEAANTWLASPVSGLRGTGGGAEHSRRVERPISACCRSAQRRRAPSRTHGDAAAVKSDLISIVSSSDPPAPPDPGSQAVSAAGVTTLRRQRRGCPR
eukprot:scaffold11620_cov119-Isochrysis_galbana.AAC.6